MSIVLKKHLKRSKCGKSQSIEAVEEIIDEPTG